MGKYNELRIIVAGSRDFNDFKLLFKTVESIKEQIIINDCTDVSKVRIISGTARGADKLGERYADMVGLPVKRFYADWDNLGKRAGCVRNAEMAKYASGDGCYGALIAFWDGKSKGTKHMIDLAKKYGLEVDVMNF